MQQDRRLTIGSNINKRKRFNFGANTEGEGSFMLMKKIFSSDFNVDTWETWSMPALI